MRVHARACVHIHMHGVCGGQGSLLSHIRPREGTYVHQAWRQAPPLTKPSCQPLFILCRSLKDWCLVSSGRGGGILSILQEAPFAKETITDTVKASKPGGRKHGGFRDWMPAWMSRAARHRHRQVEFECLFGILSPAPVGRRVFWWVVVFLSPLPESRNTPGGPWPGSLCWEGCP